MDEPVDPNEVTTRRGWLSALARSARERAREASDALGPGGLEGLVNQLDPFSGVAQEDALTEPSPAGAWGQSSRRPARAPDRAVAIDELIAVAHEEGLTERDSELRSLARRSLRMTPVVPRCADGWIRTADEWVDAPGAEVLLAQVNLSAAGDVDWGLPSEGWLVVFAGSGEGQSSAETSDVHPVHVHAVVLDSPAHVPAGAEPVALAPETMLPRAWDRDVQPIDFDGAELAAYARLRARVQDLQGVDHEDDGGADIAYHRLLGYPEGTTGATPVVGGEAEASTVEDWRLLAQISIGAWRRAYVWIREGDLRLADFTNLRAFVS